MLSVVAGLAAATAAPGALAQDDQQAKPAVSSRLSYTGVEKIVVSARKREESAQDTPVAITAIPRAAIEKYDLTNLEKVAASVPQMSIARASNGSAAQISLRGIGSTFTSIGIEQSVTTVVDGVYYPLGRVINEGLLDVAQIEVLKGPQALFFGKNATAGVLSITTADPGDETEIMGRVGYEFKAEELLGEAIFSTPLSDKLGLRVAIRGSKMWGGYVRTEQRDTTYNTFDVATGDTNSYLAPSTSDTGPETRQLIVRTTLKWTPTDKFTATLKGSVNIDRQGNPAWNYVTYSCSSGFHSLAPGQPCMRDFVNTMSDMPTEIAQVTQFSRPDGKLSNSYDSYNLTLKLEYAFDDMTLTSVSNYQRNVNIFRIDGDYVASDLSGVWANERAAFRALSNETRLLTEYDGPLNFMVGFLYQDTKLDVHQAVVLGGLENSDAPSQFNFLSWDKPSATKGDTIAVFGQVIWNITPELELAPGVRYTHETKNSYIVQAYINPALAAVYPPDQPVYADQKFTNWSPEVTLTWKPTDDLMVYVAYQTGYKSGGFSNTGIISAFGAPEDFSFDPEKVKGFEGGIKGTLFDRQLRFDLGAYYYKFTNLQVDFFNATTVSFITTNAGASTIKGAELALNYAPAAVDGLVLRFSVNYNKARYKDYIAPCWGGQTTGEGCTLVRYGIPAQDLSGFPPTNAPSWTGLIGADYNVQVANGFFLGFSIDARYSDGYLASAFGNPVSYQPSYVTLDATIRLATSDDQWELALIGRNLTNKFIIMGTADLVGTGSGTGQATAVRSDVYGLAGFPRTVQLQLKWHY